MSSVLDEAVRPSGAHSIYAKHKMTYLGTSAFQHMSYRSMNCSCKADFSDNYGKWIWSRINSNYPNPRTVTARQIRDK